MGKKEKVHTLKLCHAEVLHFERHARHHCSFSYFVSLVQRLIPSFFSEVCPGYSLLNIITMSNYHLFGIHQWF